MSDVAWTSAGYLKDEQYRDSFKLALRANLHSYGRGDWFEWAAGQIASPAQQQALRRVIGVAFEAGGGVFRVRKSAGLFVCRK